jgi:hypothetical protein
MNNISDKTLIWVGIAGIAGVVVAGISGVFKKSDNKMPPLVNANFSDTFKTFPELSGEKGGSRKNSKKRNRTTKKKR